MSHIYPALNFALFQTGWLLTVSAAAKGNMYLGFRLLIPLGIAHFYFSRNKCREAVFLLAASTLGSLIDSILIFAGIYRPAANPGAFYSPPWLVALWLMFAMTFQGCLKWTVGQAPRAAAFGVVGGPLTYLAARRLGAITLHPNLLWAGIVFSLYWAAAMAALSWGASRVQDNNDSGASPNSGRY